MAPKAAVVVFSSSTMVLVPIELHMMQKETLCWPYIFRVTTAAKEVLNNVQKNMARSA